MLRSDYSIHMQGSFTGKKGQMVREEICVCSSGICGKIRQHNMTSLKTDNHWETALVRMTVLYPHRQADQTHGSLSY